MSFADGYEANPSWRPTSREQALQLALAVLPASARAKYDEYVALVEDAAALMGAAQQRLRDAEDKFQVAIDRADRAARAAAQGGVDAAAAARAREAAEAVRHEYQAVAAEQARRRGAHGMAEQVVVRLNTFLLSGLPHCRAATVQARPQDGESLLQAIERVRASISQVQRELGRVRSAPLPAETIAESIRDQVRQLAAQGMPIVTISGGDIPPRIEWPDQSLIGATSSLPLAASRMLCALFPDQIEKLLLNGVERIQGIDPTERAERLAKLNADILRLEHEEESLITQALDKGIAAERRADVSGYGLLSLEPIPIAEMAVAAE